MDRDTREYINQLAQSVRTAYDISIPVTDIENVVRQMGGSITTEVGVDSIYDGTIRKVGESSFKIKISPRQSPERKNFTIAHELGHLFLHMGYRTNLRLWRAQNEKEFCRFGYSDQEYQANEFAAAFLMPKDEFLKVLRDHTNDGRVNMAVVAKTFKVSISAAINRGKFLGYLA